MIHTSNTAKIHTISVQDAQAILRTKLQVGLNSSDIAKRRKQYGDNTIKEEEGETLLIQIIKQLTNPLALILLVAFGLTIWLQEYIDAGVIITATIINVIISLYQERKAGNAFRALNASRTHEAIVIRNGAQQVVPAEVLVPGDVVLLQAGAYVPADGRLTEVNRLAINQVMFTGESEAIEKQITVNDESRPFDRDNMAFMGSVVMRGSGVMIVSATGMNTEFGQIAEQLGSIRKDLSPIQRSMKTVAKWLGVVTLCALLLVLLLGLYQGNDFYETLLLAVAVGVSAVPEGLLSAVTVVLAFGARSIMRQGGLVKNLTSAETLGSADYILTDKTGTLTYGKMKTEGWYTLNNSNMHELKRGGALACDVFYDLESKQYVGDEMDVAIIDSVADSVDEYESLQLQAEPVDVIPFDSAYKFFVSLRKEHTSHNLYIKGAPEILLQTCEYVLDGNQHRAMNDADREYFQSVLHEQSKKGRRILAVCSRQGVEDSILETMWDTEGQPTLPGELVFMGLIAFYDQVRSSVPDVIAGMRDSGTAVLMVTGDSAETGHRIALESGIIYDEKEPVYIGKDIDESTDEHLLGIMENGQARVFARVTPKHKLRLATILQNTGYVVAMTGDGVNDAPALQKATIGVSLAGSTEVAKEAADLLLVNDSFHTIAYAIDEGRRMVSNLKKTIVYLISTSFSIVFVLVGSMVVGGPTPFYPTQILWANIIEEGLMNFAFIFEPLEKFKPKDKRDTRVTGRHAIRVIAGLGVFNGLVTFGLYLYLNTLGISDELLRTYMFAALSIDNIFFGLALKSLYDPLWRIQIFNNMYLIMATCLSFAMFALVLAIPFMRTILHLEVITWGAFALIMCYGLVNLLVVEVVKKVCRPV